jgi:alkanesulfonate monooxygenase SsuD/methylene tetrahydromethanopterin reductase-like flavin-dependent oxidoreductase (luciferase family)
VPIIMGGKGKRRTPALAARYAGEFNTVGVSPEVMAERNARVVAACLEIARDPASMVWSTYQTVVCGRTDAEVARRLDAKGWTLEQLRADGILVGTPGEVVEGLGRYAAAGADRVYLELWDLADFDFLEVVAEQVAPQLV